MNKTFPEFDFNFQDFINDSSLSDSDIRYLTQSLKDLDDGKLLKAYSCFEIDDEKCSCYNLGIKKHIEQILQKRGYPINVLKTAKIRN